MMPVLETALAYDAMNVVQMVQRASENYELSQKTCWTRVRRGLHGEGRDGAEDHDRTTGTVCTRSPWRWRWLLSSL
ncbi:hypothetical protein PF003_g35027 [Phytophthora fragariae]|nr:hypothetical protein PF003_g35027 [Phytophthora fragariae]